MNKKSYLPNKDRQNLSAQQFIQRARMKHGDRYDYSLVRYVSTHTKVDIICNHHGIFKQTPNSHTSFGSGCPRCNRGLVLTEDFVKRAIKIHGNKYDYSCSVYEGYRTKLQINCYKHGPFFQTPALHTTKKSICPRCNQNISNKERKWLDEIGVPNTREHRQVVLEMNGVSVRVDGFVRETNTVYEFWGDFWHGNPAVYCSTDINPIAKKTYGQLYEETQTKRNLILHTGYKLIEQWG